MDYSILTNTAQNTKTISKWMLKKASKQGSKQQASKQTSKQAKHLEIIQMRLHFIYRPKIKRNVVLECSIQRNENKLRFSQIIKIWQKSSFRTPRHPIGTLPSRIAVFKMKTSTVNFLNKHDHTELFVVSFFEIQPRSL